MQRKNIEELDEFIKNLIYEMVKTSERSTSVFFRYQVCAAIVDEENKVYRGVNWDTDVDNVCAEVGAISLYVLSDRKRIKSVITYGHPCQGKDRTDSFCTPCGKCRQRLYRYCNNDTIVYGINETATEAEIFRMEELLPYSFNSSNLKSE